MKLLQLLGLAGLAIATPKTYDGYKVLRIKAQDGIDFVQQKLSSLGTYDVWEKTREYMDVALSPEQLSKFKSLGLDSHAMHEDLGASIAAESATPSFWNRQSDDDEAWFDSYHAYADHKQYWIDLQARFPNNSELVSTGTSYEGRDLFGLHLWGSGGPGKKAVLWHSTVHAREWISTMVVEYLTLNLIKTYPIDNLTKSFLDKYDFYIFPFVNPDGFVYTQTTQRLWRKNRQPGPNNATCYGRDVNRQWPYGWDFNPEGASDNPCDETYHGEAPSDGPESQGLVKFTNNLRDTVGIRLFIDWHSYSQFIIFPYGWNCTIFPADAGKLTYVAALASSAIRDVHNTTFTFGQACNLLGYYTSGGSRDHMREQGKADWSYTVELRDYGNYGFVLPPELIRPSVEEQWVGVRTLVAAIDSDIPS